jgi:3',5'-cyclic-AMP phosphodiesterase
MAGALGRRIRTGAAIAVGAGIVAAAPSCIRTTPFKSDPSVTDLTTKHLARLATRSPPAIFKLAALGDTHANYDDLKSTVKLINARDDIELVLIVGDMTDQGLLQEFEWSYEVYRELDVPFLTVIGNHDALGKGDDIYREMYGPYDYSFRYGDMKFVMFNTNTLEFGRGVPRRDWVTAEVEDRGTAAGVLLVGHGDPTRPDDYADGDSAAFYADLVQRPGVSGFVHGHQAAFELLEWQGVPVLQCGTYEATFFHTIITIDAGTLSFERCRFDVCEPVVPVLDPGLGG